MPSSPPAMTTRASLADLVGYFLYLGALGFGGPVALAGFMHRDLVEKRRWIDEEEYGLALALAQIMPGPLAAQLAIAAYKLARSTNKRDPLLWAIFGVLALVTVWAQAELAEFFVLAGFVALFARSRPSRRQAVAYGLGGLLVLGIIWLIERWFVNLTLGGEHVLLQILVFFAKAGAFVFGSGLAIVPFLHQGVVQQFGWLNEHQFLDAVAVAMITPGPVVITVVFIGYLVTGILGATMAAIGIFLPVYLFTIIPAPWFKRNRDNAQLKAFVQGATAAATGALSGAVIVLAYRAIYDLPTAAVALASLAVLWRFKVPEPILVTAAGAIGLIVWPLVKGG